VSIWASWESPSDDLHEDGCAIYRENPPGSNCFEFSGNPCSCGQPDAPILYQGSHVLPSPSDKRGGYVDIAAIPAHVRYWREHPDGRDEPTDGPPDPYLRFGVNGETVILDVRNARTVYESLREWLDQVGSGEQSVAVGATGVSEARAENETENCGSGRTD
jgi:hypothetical protein